MASFLWWWVLALLRPQPITASPSVSYDMAVYIPSDALKGGQAASGQLKLRWQDRTAKDVCFYQAFNDSNFFRDPSRNINRRLNQNKGYQPLLGSIDVVKSSQEADWSRSIVRLPNKGFLELEFDFVLPQWPDRAREQFLFHQFYPQKLEVCPPSRGDAPIVSPAKFQAQLSYPRGWTLTSPGYHNEKMVTQEGRFLTFNLSKAYRVETFLVRQLPVTMVYRSEYMVRAKTYLRGFINQGIDILGNFPFKKLIFVETEDLEKNAIPGVISLNRPRQRGMGMFQNQYLNWGIWQLAYYTAQQWYGAALYSHNKDDSWFFRGSADFLASLFLKARREVYDIMNFGNSEDSPWFTFNYNQSADLIASLLGIVSPENALTTLQVSSRIKYLDQHNFNYVRHLLALRFAHWYKQDEFIQLLREYYLRYRGRHANQRDFISLLRAESQDSLANYLQQWWQQSDWPDFAIGDLSYLHNEGGVTAAKVKVNQNSSLKLPVDLQITLSSGQVLSKRLMPQQEQVIFNFGEVALDDHYPIAGLSVVKMELNPGREIFDSNRFNNSNQWPSLVFFPGNADTLRDDAYTVVWLPFIAKLPGEPLSIMLNSQIFKYVKSGLSLLVNHFPKDDVTGYNLIYLADFPSISSYLMLSAVQDFNVGLRGQRIIDLSLTGSNILPSVPGFSLGLRLRHRGSTGIRDQSHGTVSLLSTLQTQGMAACGASVQGIHEDMLSSSLDFHYKRSIMLVSGFCRSKWLGLSLRGFVGAVQEEGSPPSDIRFFPQTATEGRLRIDAPNLVPVQKLWTGSIDIDLPAHLPVPSYLLLLPSHSRWRFFYDFGQSLAPEFEYYAYGLGFKLPLGGDIVGKRSFSVASLSVLGVLGKSYEGKSSKKPGVLIDFLGNL